MTEAQLCELVNLYHLARTALAGTGKDTRYQRMLWASREYAKTSTISEMGAYKALDRALA